MLVCGIYSFKVGKPNMLLVGWDSDHNGCGYSKETIDYPYLYWPEMINNQTYV